MRLRVAGLFAGIGGIELGLDQAGHTTDFLCENDRAALAVLRRGFPDKLILGDIRELHQLPAAIDLAAAGFPCQDLSQAGMTAGIAGARSGLVNEVFRLLERRPGPRWVLLENVPFMLQLDRGRAMRHLTTRLGELGYRWAYRVVDARSFGLPQRRQRVLLLASRTDDPRPVLFGQDAGEPDMPNWPDVACGFYWTEGLRGLGWAPDAVPTLKGGSSVGIPSPPAIWTREGTVGVPDIRDAERLQGFAADWTAGDQASARQRGLRWKLVGNAVSVPVSAWLGKRLARPNERGRWTDAELSGSAWPTAAWGDPGAAPRRADVSMWPVRRKYRHLEDFLEYELQPLSARATEGFLERARRSQLRFHPAFLAHLERHLETVRRGKVAA